MTCRFVLIGLTAAAIFVPQSSQRTGPSIDVVGVSLSSAGLALLMYGLVEAGDNGWGSASAVVPSIISLAVLAAFVAWEAFLTARPNGQPLIDLGLFRSRTFSVGIVLAAAGIFGMFGVLFLLPQYLQAIMGVNAQGAGLRFLPTIAGLVVGAIPADRVAARIGSRVTVALGFGILAVGMVAGSAMTTSTGDGYIAAYTFVVGAGAGLGLATAASAAMVQLSAERSGVGSALLQAIIKLGPAFGATILGSVLNSTYQSHVSVAGLPSCSGRCRPAERLRRSGSGPAARLDVACRVRAGRLRGGDGRCLQGGAVIAAVAMVGALVLLPRRSSAPVLAADKLAEPAVLHG